DGATGGHVGDAGFGEPGEVGQGKDRGRLRADERLPPLADQVRAGPQLAQRARAGEWRPRGDGIRIEQVEGVAHSRCTSSFKRSARPVGITSVWPFARTTTPPAPGRTAAKTPARAPAVSAGQPGLSSRA